MYQLHQKYICSIVWVLFLFIICTNYTLASIVGVQNPANYEWQFVSINPETANVTPIGSTLSGFGIRPGDSVIDNARSRYYLNSSVGIQVIDIQTGSLINTLNVVISSMELAIDLSLVPITSTKIPTLSEWGLALLILFLILIAFPRLSINQRAKKGSID